MALHCVDNAPIRGGKKWKETLCWCEKVLRNRKTLSLGTNKGSRVKAVFHMLKVFHAGMGHREDRPLSLPFKCFANLAALNLHIKHADPVRGDRIILLQVCVEMKTQYQMRFTCANVCWNKRKAHFNNVGFSSMFNLLIIN